MTTDKLDQSSKTISWSDPRPTAALGRELTGLEFLATMVAGEIPPAPIASHFNMKCLLIVGASSTRTTASGRVWTPRYVDADSSE